MPVELKELDLPKFGKDFWRVVSYTQFSMYMKCPKQWALAYAHNLRKREPSIYLTFGTVIHETIQIWLEKRYNNEKFDPIEYYHNRFLELYKEQADKWGDNFVEPDIYQEFYNDAVDILEYLKTKLFVQFPRIKYDLLGDEIPLTVKAHPDIDNVYMTAHLDLVFYDRVNDKYLIVDIKTSTQGWNMYNMRDDTKTSQMLLYKFFFSSLYNIDFNKIKCMYYIVKRKVQDYNDYTKKRDQEFIPIQDHEYTVEILDKFLDFVQTGFNSDGSYNLNSEYPAIKGSNGNNCKFCDFKDDEEHCPKSQRREE